MALDLHRFPAMGSPAATCRGGLQPRPYSPPCSSPSSSASSTPRIDLSRSQVDGKRERCGPRAGRVGPRRVRRLADRPGLRRDAARPRIGATRGATLRAKTAVAELAESCLARICRVVEAPPSASARRSAPGSRTFGHWGSCALRGGSPTTGCSRRRSSHPAEGRDAGSDGHRAGRHDGLHGRPRPLAPRRAVRRRRAPGRRGRASPPLASCPPVAVTAFDGLPLRANSAHAARIVRPTCTPAVVDTDEVVPSSRSKVSNTNGRSIAWNAPVGARAARLPGELVEERRGAVVGLQPPPPARPGAASCHRSAARPRRRSPWTGLVPARSSVYACSSVSGTPSPGSPASRARRYWRVHWASCSGVIVSARPSGIRRISSASSRSRGRRPWRRPGEGDVGVVATHVVVDDRVERHRADLLAAPS